MSFEIIVDSCCDLTPQQRASGLYTTVPLTIYVGETEYRDDDTLDTELLADAMAMCEQAAHTACPSPAEYLSAYEAAKGDIYVITLSALLSGSHNSAWQAAQIFREEHSDRNLHVFNSCSASAGETLVAAKIAQLAGRWARFDGEENPSPSAGEGRVDAIKKGWSARARSAFAGVCSGFFRRCPPKSGPGR